jgi:bacillithiol biosynthesis deacetylase BshB1
MVIDILAFSPHPDDADMGCGGLLLKLKDTGYRTGIIDLTEAELSSNGDKEIRQKETELATKLLKLDVRENLNLGDCNIKSDIESRLKVINIIRKYKPGLIIIPYFIDRHPDHENSYRLLKDAIFIAGLKKFKTDLACYRPKIVINYMLSYQFEPSFIIDISKYYKQKMEAFTAYKSQFYKDYDKDLPTYINSKYFFDLITSRDKYYGLKIKVEYGEPYFIDSDIKIEDPIKFFNYLF